MFVVGIGGYATSGKDTAAETLIELGWNHESLAKPLKAIALACNPWIHLRDSYGGNFVRLEEIIRAQNGDWTEAKKIKDVRDFLQRLGTEGVRDNLGPDTWIRALVDRIKADGRRAVVTDVRFPNEAQWFLNNGFPLIWIERPGVGPVNNHPSDRGIKDLCTHRVVNDGTVEELHQKLRRAVMPLIKGDH